MAIVKQYHKDVDTTYVYESESYWDAEKKQTRSTRKLLGKLDPETGEIIPTGKRGRKRKEATAEGTGTFREQLSAVSAGYTEQIRQHQMTIRQQEIEINAMRKRIAQLENTLAKAREVLGSAD